MASLEHPFDQNELQDRSRTPQQEGTPFDPRLDELRALRMAEHEQRSGEMEQYKKTRAALMVPAPTPTPEPTPAPPVMMQLPSHEPRSSAVEIAKDTTAAALTAGSAAVLYPHIVSTGTELLSGVSLGSVTTLAGIPIATSLLGGYLGKKIGRPVTGAAVGAGAGVIAANTLISTSAVAQFGAKVAGALGVAASPMELGTVLSIAGDAAASALFTPAVPIALGVGAAAYLAYKAGKKWMGRRTAGGR